MTAEDIELRKRLVQRVEQLGVRKIEVPKVQLDEISKPSPEEIKRRLAARRGVAGMLSDPEEYADPEAYACRTRAGVLRGKA